MAASNNTTERVEYKRTYYNKDQFDYNQGLEPEAPTHSGPEFEAALVKVNSEYRRVKIICIGLTIASVLAIVITLAVVLGRRKAGWNGESDF